MSAASRSAPDVREDVFLWFEVTEGLDPVEHLRASRLYFAMAEAQVALDAWRDELVTTARHRVIDRVKLAYHFAVTPFELWLESRLARTYFDLAVATPISYLADGVHDMAMAAVAGSPTDQIMLRTLRQQHQAEVLKPRVPLSDGETMTVDDEVLAALVSQLTGARALS